MEIKQNYLMWIGAAHYAKITDWTDEALTQGISKRVPSIDMAKVLTQPGTVVFVAHDEGEYEDCPTCKGIVENPERRKLEQELIRLGDEVSNLMNQQDDLEKSRASGEMSTKEIDDKVQHLQNLIARRNTKRNEISAKASKMEVYIVAGTGGKTTVEMSDGGEVFTEEWDYRKYNYWLHQPKRFNADSVLTKEMCEDCGGTGRIPKGKVFGMFVPDEIDYILNDVENKAMVDKMTKAGARLVTKTEVAAEKRRGCGKRHAGGVYVVTKTDGDSKTTKQAVEELVEQGKLSPDAVEVHGQFAHFIKPVPIDAKRFRGIKKWSLDPMVEDEAEMIADAFEDDAEIDAALDRLTA